MTTRRTTRAFFVAALFFSFSAAEAQFPGPIGPGFGAYGGFGPYRAGYWGYGGYGPYAPNNFYNGFGGYGYSGFGGYGPGFYSQQLFFQQAALNQQIYQQQQQAVVGQVQQAQATLQQLDSSKQQMLNQYTSMSDSDKAAVRAGLINDYLKLDAHGREGWKRDSAIQAIIGPNLQRLDGVAQVQEMTEADRIRYKEAMLQRYRALPPAEQLAWQKDEIIGMVMGPNWWLK